MSNRKLRIQLSQKKTNQRLKLVGYQKKKKEGYLEFDEVSFCYQGAEEPAIEKISFKTSPGELTAIIGSTGSGKSTLINLIPRFYDVTSGRILVDGVDVRELTQKKLRAKIGLVPQKVVLFCEHYCRKYWFWVQ